MSKYTPLWQHIAAAGAEEMTLTYEEIQAVLGFPIDHSFLTAKKELTALGWQVAKISMKEQKVRFVRIAAALS